MSERPPSVDALARLLAADSDRAYSRLPHSLLVRCARLAIATGGDYTSNARQIAEGMQLALIRPVINATGVLLHTNLGRAPVAGSLFGFDGAARPTSLEFDLTDGSRGSRQSSVAILLAELTGADDAVVVNNNAAAVLLVAAALAGNRDVAVSRGESVEIGGGFRIPEVIEQSGARLVDVGTTNKTRAADYERAIRKRGNDVAFILKVHPSNFRIDGFTEQAPLSALAALGVPVVSDVGSGLIDAQCPWLSGPPPQWLHGEPAVRQTLSEGAALVTFSGDKLLGGPQCGIIAGRADLVAACRSHPLMRALRPGGNTIIALQHVLLSYASRTASSSVPFWTMATATLDDLRHRAELIAAATGARVVETSSLPGAGSTPGSLIPSVGISVRGDHLGNLRNQSTPVIARLDRDATVLDIRTIDREDDAAIIEAIRSLAAS